GGKEKTIPATIAPSLFMGSGAGVGDGGMKLYAQTQCPAFIQFTAPLRAFLCYCVYEARASRAEAQRRRAAHGRKTACVCFAPRWHCSGRGGAGGRFAWRWQRRGLRHLPDHCAGGRGSAGADRPLPGLFPPQNRDVTLANMLDPQGPVIAPARCFSRFVATKYQRSLALHAGETVSNSIKYLLNFTITNIIRF